MQTEQAKFSHFDRTRGDKNQIFRYLGGADLMVFLGYDTNDFFDGVFYGGTTGIASANIVCVPHPDNTKDKWSINEYSNEGASGMAAVSNVNYEKEFTKSLCFALSPTSVVLTDRKRTVHF